MNRRPARPQPPISEERLAEILRRIQERRRRAQLRAGTVAVVAVAVVAGVGLPRLFVGSDGVQSLRLTSSQTPSASSNPTVNPTSAPSARFGTRIPGGSGPLVLETAYAGGAVIARLGSSDPPYRVVSRTPLAEPVSDPAGGWIVVSSPSYLSHGRGPERLARVDAAGHVHVFGPVTHHGEGITGLAVSPDAARVAVAFAGGASQSRAKAYLTVIPTPGHSGGNRTWTLEPAEFDSQIGSLSWAPDGRHLTYIATDTTGGGFAGTPLTMDTEGFGSTIPPPTNLNACDQTESGGWLGGKYVAVVNSCRGGRHLHLVVSNAPGQPPLRAAVPIGDRGGQADGLSATSDGRQILVSFESTPYLITAQHVRTLSDTAGYRPVMVAFAGGTH